MKVDDNNTKKSKQKIKCVVWDLDNTIWDGILMENDNVSLNEGIIDIIKTIDNRGILQSIASKNEQDIAMHKIRELGINEYFIYPQINWNKKSESILTISKLFNINIDTFAFIDDEPFELEEVKYFLPAVLCINSKNIDGILCMDEFNPEFITEDSGMRRSMYIKDIERKRLEEEYSGSHEEFLALLDMKLKICEAKDGDLSRVIELTERTHQMNTTGYIYTYNELDCFRRSEKHKLLMVSLDDKFGTYGKVGIVLLECLEDLWTIKLLILSCRIMSRGIGAILVNYVSALAKENSVRLHAEFVSNDRNRTMYVTYKFAGFHEIIKKGNFYILENDLANIQPFPKYIEVITNNEIENEK